MISKYLKNTITLFSGNILSQLFMILSLPILTRLYSSINLGEYFVFLSITIILSSVFSLQSHLSIVLGKNTNEATQNLRYSIIIIASNHLLLLILIFILQSYLTQDIGFNIANKYIFFYPLSSFLTALSISFESFLNHQKSYFNISKLKALKVGIIITLQLISPLIIKPDYYILIIGQITGLFIIDIIYIFKLHTFLLSPFNTHLTNYIKSYKNILLYNTGMATLNTASNHIPLLLINSLFGASFASFFGIAIRITATPFNMFGQSLGMVYYQKGAQIINYKKRLLPLFNKTFMILFRFGILPFILIIIFSKTAIDIFLGNEYKVTGQIIQILSPMLFVSFLNSAISYTVEILGLQRQMIWYDFILFLIRTSTILVGFYVFNNFFSAIILFSTTGILLGTLFFVAIKHHTKKYDMSLNSIL